MLPWYKDKIFKKIAVIGDIILDEYLEGDVERISPEAPVPVHLIKKQHYSAGGAANAARNVQLLGGETFLFSIWGQDESANILGNMLKADEINLHGVVTVDGRPTIKKTRITSGHQQMLRVDWEKAQEIDPHVQEILISRFSTLNFDAILISDYGKGSLPVPMLKKMFSFAHSKKIPIVVDPKGKDFHRYQGCDLITPNRKEACEALGYELDQAPNGEELGRQLQRKFGLHHILVTLGSEGMVFVPHEEKEKPIFYKPMSREVYDVSGAGDTVAALMTLSLSCQLSFEQAVKISSIGAGLVVEKWGTQALHRQELERTLDNKSSPYQSKPSSKKICMLENILTRLESLKKQGKKIVFTNGCFDLFHAGHLSYLEKTKNFGDILVIGVNSDDSVRALKGHQRPLVSATYRMQVLAGLECVDFVVPFDELDPLNLIKSIKPDVLVKGADYKKEDIIGYKTVTSYGGKVRVIDLVDGLSTSELLRKITAQMDTTH